MTDLTDVLHRATEGLSPEAPDLLLEGAVRRGAGLRRRRRAVTAASAVSGLAAVGVLMVALLGRPAPTTRTTPVEPGPTASSATTAPEARVTVARHDFGATFRRIIPGTITDEHDTPAGRVHEKDGYASDFLWNGYRVYLMIAPRFHHDPGAECRQATRGSFGTETCVRVRGGWASRDSTMYEQDYARYASVHLDNGFRMWVMINNSSGEKGSATGGPPPLDVPDLERVATSDLWFR